MIVFHVLKHGDVRVGERAVEEIHRFELSPNLAPRIGETVNIQDSSLEFAKVVGVVHEFTKEGVEVHVNLKNRFDA